MSSLDLRDHFVVDLTQDRLAASGVVTDTSTSKEQVSDVTDVVLTMCHKESLSRDGSGGEVTLTVRV